MGKKLIQVVYSVNDQALLKAEKSLKENEAAAKKADEAVKKYGKDSAKAGDQASSSFFNLKNIIATIGIVQLGKQIIQVTAVFQKLEAVLTNSLGSKSAAQLALKNIQEIAAKTPFSVTQLTESYVKLVNQGIKPTNAEIIKLGDLASSTGKEFGQLTEAVIDAQTGEFERLKEFGIRATKEGDKVAFTFKGVKTQVDFTTESIKNYIVSLGAAEGVSGSMAAVSETLGGKISNLGDAWDQFLNTVGDGNKGILSGTVSLLTKAVEKARELLTTDAQEAEQRQTAVYQEQIKVIDDLIKSGASLGDARKTALGNLRAELGIIDITLKRMDDDMPKLEDSAISSQSIIAQEAFNKASEERNRLMNRYNDLVNEGQKGIIEYTNTLRKEADQKRELAADTLAKARAEADEIVKGGEAIFQAMKAKEGEDEKEKKDRQKRLDDLKAYGGNVIVEIKGQVDTELEIRRKKTEEEIRLEEEAAQSKMELQQMSFDYGLMLLGQFLMAQTNASDQAFHREKGNFDRRLLLVGDNERARQEIEAERLKFQEEQDAKAQAHSADQARKDKERQVKQMIIQSVLNSLKALGNPPVPNFASAGITGLFGLGQIAIAKSVGFKEGGINIQGPGTGTSDSINAKISKGESVITADATARSLNLLTAINERRIDDRILHKAAGTGPRTTVDMSRVENKLDTLIERAPDYYQEGLFVNKVITKKKFLKTHTRAKYGL